MGRHRAIGIVRSRARVCTDSYYNRHYRYIRIRAMVDVSEADILVRQFGGSTDRRGDRIWWTLAHADDIGVVGRQLQRVAEFSGSRSLRTLADVLIEYSKVGYGKSTKIAQKFETLFRSRSIKIREV